MHYCKAGGLCIALLMLLIQAIGRGLDITGAFWLAAWADKSSSEEVTESETTFYVAIYAVFGMLGIMALAVRSLLMAQHRLRASTKLHEDLTQRIFKAPVSYFDVSPIGRIPSRFTADIDKTDLVLTVFLTRGLDAVFGVVGSVYVPS
jgi:ATP-binding cassette subfamily C (CFTR/MRP) protein 1